MTTPAATTPRLSWPPPGLERVPGRLSALVAALVLGDLLLILPLIASVATTQDFLSFGAFGASWWVPILSTALGVIVLAGAFEKLVRLLWSASKAAQAGHGWRLVLHVLADVDRDSGFLIQGIRHYEGASPAERKTILELRLAGTLAYAGAAVWAPFGFSLGVMVAAAGWVGPGTIWVLAVVLPALAAVAGLALRFTSELLARSLRKGTAADRADALGTEVASWSETLAEAASSEGFNTGGPRQHRAFRLIAVGLVLVGVMAVLPPVALTASGGIGPLLASITVPQFARMQARLARAEVLRAYAAPVDPAVSPEEAGEALQVLSMVGIGERDPALRAPVREYDSLWLDDSVRRALGGERTPGRWAEGLLERSARGFTAEEFAALRSIARHPAQAEFASVAAADLVDVVGTRWVTPFPEGTRAWDLPIPRYASLREGAMAHLALAAFELSEGNPASAERAIREVISLGLVLMDDAPFLIDNVIGVTVVVQAGQALIDLYRATGRPGDAARLEELRDAVARAVDRMAAPPEGGESRSARVLYPSVVWDTAFAPGFRWEYFSVVSGFAGCLNLHTLVFGPGRGYAAWRATAHDALVRLPSEEEFFRVLGQGVFGEDGCGTLFDQLRLLRMIY